MKNTLAKYWALLLMTWPLLLGAQIPNSDFENWDSVTMHNPAGYRIYGTTMKVTGYKSPFAVRIMKNELLNQGPGAVIYGDPENGFNGGIPAVGRPDSAVGYFKYHVVPGDTAWFLVYLKKKGQFISQDIFKITGSDSNTFRRLAYKINYSDTGVSDSLIVGVASSNPNDYKFGSFIIADSLHFIGGIGTITIPNGNFEQWISRGMNTLNGWFTSNLQGSTGGTLSVTKTTDHVFTKYACRIENVPLGNGQFHTGYIMAGRQGNNGPEPGFPVNGNDSVLYANYKCFPKGGDTINIAILMFRNDSIIGMGNFRQWLTINSWSQIAIPISYSNGKADSAVIFCSAFQGGSNPRGNTILYVDGLSLNKAQSGIRSLWRLPAKTYPNPVIDIVTIDLTVSIKIDSKVTLTDICGRKIIMDYQTMPDGKSIRMNVSNIPSGIWYYAISGETEIQSGKIIINK